MGIDLVEEKSANREGTPYLTTCFQIRFRPVPKSKCRLEECLVIDSRILGENSSLEEIFFYEKVKSKNA